MITVTTHKSLPLATKEEATRFIFFEIGTPEDLAKVYVSMADAHGCSHNARYGFSVYRENDGSFIVYYW